MNKKFKHLNIILIVSAAAAILCSCVFSTLYTNTSNDVIFMGTPIPFIMSIMRMVFEAIYIACCSAVCVCTLYLFSDNKKNRLIYFISVAAVIIFKHAANAVIAVMGGSYSDSFDFFSVMVNIIADVIVIGAAVWLAAVMLENHRSRVKKLEKASKYVDDFDPDSKAMIYPFSSFFSMDHPILKPLFVSAAVYAGMGILSRLIFDLGLGAPINAAETAEMIFAYIGDILFGLIVYTASYFSSMFILSEMPTDVNL